MKASKKKLPIKQVPKKPKKKFPKRSTFKLYWREIANWFYIGRTIRKQKKKDTWYTLNLRSDWVNRIYTVVNIRKEDVGDADEIKKAKVFELIMPINKYIKSLDMHEIVYPVIEQLSDQSYLIVYVPIFEKFTVLRTLKYLFVIGISITAIILTLLTLL